MFFNVIVGQSGGPTCAINASLAGVVKKANEVHATKIYGMLHGIKGFLDDKYIDFSDYIKNDEDLELLKRTPASFLGSCRFKLPNLAENPSSIEEYERIFSKLKALSITHFFYIGGNDSMDTIKKLSDYAKKIGSDIRFMGVPKTIDNDLAVTDHTPGYGSAAKFIATTVKELVCDCRIYDSPALTIVEIMGRNAGWLTASVALARGDDCEGADMIFLPEKPLDLDFFVQRVEEITKNKKYCVVAISEGVRTKDGRLLCELNSSLGAEDAFGHKIMSGAAKYLERLVKQKLGIKVRSVEISTLQRCASHFASLTDIQEAYECGAAAVSKAVLEKQTGKVVCMMRKNNAPYTICYETADVHEIANIEKSVPVEWITKDYVTNDAVTYIAPLIQGEFLPLTKNGIPRHLRLPPDLIAG